MRQPALSGPEKENSRERVEYVPAKHPGAITREFGIPSRTLGLSPLGCLDRHPFPVYLQIQPKPILSLAPVLSPFPSRRPSKMDMTRAHSALCAAAKRNAYFDRISFHTPPLSFCYCKGVGVGCACALLSHRLSLVEATALRGSPDERIECPFFIPPSPRPNLPGHDIIIVKHNFLFRRKRRQALRMSKGNAAIRVTSKPKERHASITARPIRGHARKYVFWGVSGRKEAVPKAGKERNEADKGQGHDIQARTRSGDYGIPRQRAYKASRYQAM